MRVRVSACAVHPSVEQNFRFNQALKSWTESCSRQEYYIKLPLINHSMSNNTLPVQSSFVLKLNSGVACVHMCTFPHRK